MPFILFVLACIVVAWVWWEIGGLNAPLCRICWSCIRNSVLIWTCLLSCGIVDQLSIIKNKKDKFHTDWLNMWGFLSVFIFCSILERHKVNLCNNSTNQISLFYFTAPFFLSFWFWRSRWDPVCNCLASHEGRERNPVRQHQNCCLEVRNRITTCLEINQRHFSFSSCIGWDCRQYWSVKVIDAFISEYFDFTDLIRSWRINQWFTAQSNEQQISFVNIQCCRDYFSWQNGSPW